MESGYRKQLMTTMSLQQVPSLGMFVKNIAVSVFGTEYLKSHSVSGKGSNKTKSKPRPAIDSTKALAIRGNNFMKNYVK